MPKYFMIDENGFRHNVGMVIANAQGQVFWGRRAGNPTAWQFPQGGINEGETEQDAMYRELGEELGLAPDDVQILDQTQEWLYYTLPVQYQRVAQKPLCIGQKQKWFLLRLISADDQIKLDYCDPPEFDQWRWVEYWYPVSEVVAFKQAVYQKVLEQFSARR